MVKQSLNLMEQLAQLCSFNKVDDNTRLLFRIEDIDGWGPYQSRNCGERIRPPEHLKLAYEMSVKHSQGWRGKVYEGWFERACAVGMNGAYFACTTEEELRRWFGPYLKRIEAQCLRFFVVCYRVHKRDVCAFSGHASFSKTRAEQVWRVTLGEFLTR